MCALSSLWHQPGAHKPFYHPLAPRRSREAVFGGLPSRLSQAFGLLFVPGASFPLPAPRTQTHGLTQGMLLDPIAFLLGMVWGRSSLGYIIPQGLCSLQKIQSPLLVVGHKKRFFFSFYIENLIHFLTKISFSYCLQKVCTLYVLKTEKTMFQSHGETEDSETYPNIVKNKRNICKICLIQMYKAQGILSQLLAIKRE